MKNSQVGDLLVASTIVEGTVLNRGVCLLVHEDQDRTFGVLLNRPMQATVAHASTHPITPPKSFPAPVEGLSDKPKRFEAPAARQADQRPRPEQPQAEPDVSQSDEPKLDSNQTITVVGPKHDPAAGQMLSGKSLHFGGPLSGPVVAIHGTAELAEAEAGDGIFMAAQRDHLEALLGADQSQPYRLIVGHLGWSHEQLDHEISEGVWHRMPATADILRTPDDFLWPTLIRRATSHSVARWLGTDHVADANELN